MIIGLGYKKLSGKDTVGEILVKDYGFKRMAFADELKLEVRRIWYKTIMSYVRDSHDGGNGYWAELSSQWDYDEYPPPDEEDLVHWLVYTAKPPFIVSLLQEHGTELRRREDPDYWIRKLFNNWYDNDTIVIPDVRFKNDSLVITDVRFKNEARFCKYFGKVVRIDRKIDRPDYGTHISETELDTYEDWDYVLDNNGTFEDLINNTKKMMDYFSHNP